MSGAEGFLQRSTINFQLSMHTEKIIGFEVEPRLYRVGSFVLRQVAGTDRLLSEPDPTMQVLKILGLTNPSSILDMTIQKYWDDLEATGKVKEALGLILQVEKSEVRGQRSEVRGRKSEGRGQKADVRRLTSDFCGRIPRRLAAEVLKDFFAMNFGSRMQSEVIAGSTASS